MGSKTEERPLLGHGGVREIAPLLVTLMLGVFMGALDLSALSPALHQIGTQFSAGPRALSWIFTAYLLAYVVAIPVMSKLSDVYGRRAIYIFDVSLFAVGSLIAIAAPSYQILILGRVVQAVGAGGIFPVATATVADRVPEERRGGALGMLGAVWGLAGVVGPALGGAIVHVLDWRWVFAINLPLAAVVIALTARNVHRGGAPRRGPLDFAGIVLLGAALLAGTAGLTRVDAANLWSAANVPSLWELVIAAVLLLAFAAVERQAADPVVPPVLLRIPTLRLANVLEIGIGVLEGSLFFVPAALMAAEGLNAVAAGALAALAAFCFVAVVPMAGRALDKVGARAVLFVGSLLVTIGMAAFAASLANLGLAIVSLVVAGLGFGALLGAPTRYLVTSAAPREMRATAVGLLSVFLIFGQIAGGSLAGAMVGHQLTGVAGYVHAYVLFAVVAALVTLLTLRIPRKA
ncbi:MAG TPA: MFS transporter [Candidatus Dormibacteraeota bacterium]|nr:MFS transporter [Candidatus Dormibacteraeota bacterium]